MKIARLIIYEGSEEWIKATLSMSLREGVCQMGDSRFITVIELDTAPAILFLDPRPNSETFKELDK
jgi:hypothetical protein